MNSILSLARNIRVYMHNFTETLQRQYFFHPELALAGSGYPLARFPEKNNQSSQSTLDDIIGNGFLWAVPKHRRSLERRMTRRMGFGKVIKPMKNIIVCDACGHYHAVHTLCGNCYEVVKKETEIMQEAVMKELKLDPIDKEVVILYENEPKETGTIGGKRIIELPKERPQWFCKNLLEKDSEIPRKKTTTLSEISISPKVENV